MKINAINSFMRPIRNVAAAAVVAASPLAAKADTSALAKTNVVDTVSSAALCKGGLSADGMYYCIMPTNNLPTKVEWTSFNIASPTHFTATAVANGEVKVGKVLGGSTLEELATNPKIVDNFWIPDAVYEPGTATKLNISFPNDGTNKFFRVAVNQDAHPELGDRTGIYQWVDANGNPIQ